MKSTCGALARPSCPTRPGRDAITGDIHLPSGNAEAEMHLGASPAPVSSAIGFGTGLAGRVIEPGRAPGNRKVEPFNPCALYVGPNVPFARR